MWRVAALALGLVWATGAGAEITAARYVEPTDRYDHGVLGDALEWAALELRLRDGRKVTVRLPESRVFEDLAPGLADLDGDGAPEVIVVETDLTLGAQLAVYGERGKIAATPFIGRRHRWLAPLGAADLDGDGRVEIAYIDRPHLTRTLLVWRLEGGAMVEVAAAAGLTNHRIGDAFIQGGIADCGDGPVIVTANADWTQVMETTLRSGRLTAKPVGRYEGRASIDDRLACSN